MCSLLCVLNEFVFTPTSLSVTMYDTVLYQFNEFTLNCLFTTVRYNTRNVFYCRLSSVLYDVHDALSS